MELSPWGNDASVNLGNAVWMRVRLRQSAFNELWRDDQGRIEQLLVGHGGVLNVERNTCFGAALPKSAQHVFTQNRLDLSGLP
jgi:hypothetical protein